MARMPQEILEEIYQLHESGDLEESDQRWLVVDKQLNAFARAVVKQVSPTMYGQLYEEKVQHVAHQLLTKFLRKKFSNANNFSTLLWTSAKNELLSHHRRDKSPTATSFDGVEETWVCPNSDDVVSDPASQDPMFDRVRARFSGPFRFPEYEYTREALLAYFLVNGTHPTAEYLESFRIRGAGLRAIVHMAALFDINTAMMRVTHET